MAQHDIETERLLDALRRRAAPVVAELREWAQRDTDPWKVDGRRHGARQTAPSPAE